MRFAAIDIGSNAVRLLFANVFKNDGVPVFRKESLVRVPLRLGEEAFIDKRLSYKKIEHFVKTMKAFKLLMDVHEVTAYQACATSAMREAENGAEIVERVKREANLDIDIITGQQEAKIIYKNHIIDELDPDKNYLYIDVGGGSTEISLFHDCKLVESHSFKIGTLRLLNNMVSDRLWVELRSLLKDIHNKYPQLHGIGSGGNINKIYKLYGDDHDNSIMSTALQEAYDDITGYSYAERVKLLGFKPDRADVIIPASEIFLFITKWAGIEKIFVPKVGLADGLIRVLYDRYEKSIPELPV